MKFADERPNILYIMSDDHASNAISAYKSRLASVFETPNIDRIAKSGCILKRCQCTNNICTPSRATIMTGQYSHKTGVKTLADDLDPNIETYPMIMKKAGYQTAIFGKWHLHTQPVGYDDYSILPGQGLYNDPWFIDKGMEFEKHSIPNTSWGKMEKGYVSDLITDKCIKWLEDRDKNKPFVLMCHHKAPHGLFEYHKRYEHMFDGIEIPEPDNLFENKDHRSDGSKDFGTTISDRNLRMNWVKRMSQTNYPTGQLDLTNLNSKERTKAAYQKYLKEYLRTVKGIDDNVGRLLDYLDDNNLTENTVIIYTSDQGMFLGEHDYLDKRWIYKEASTMPFLISYKKEIEVNSINDNIISNIDFAPTILDYAGLDKTDLMQGNSFRQLLNGSENIHWEDTAYNRYWMNMAHHDVPAHYGIITKEYKLIYFYGLPLDAKGAIDYVTPEAWELYDLVKDPDENCNVYNMTEYSSVIVNLKKKLKEMKNLIGDEDSKYKEMLELKNGLY